MSHELPQAPTAITPASVSEVKTASFWVSQLFVLLATVAGVYLAASQGYKQAVQFEHQISIKNSYYLQQSLQYEIADNIEIIRAYIEKGRDSSYPNAKKEALNLHSLIWENMTQSNDTLRTDPEILRLAQNFYRNVATYHESIAEGNIGASYGFEQLETVLIDIENKLIPMIEKSNDKLKAQLDKTLLSL